MPECRELAEGSLCIQTAAPLETRPQENIMSTTEDAIRVISAVEAFLPIVVGLVRDLKAVVSGSASKSVAEILQDADNNWTAVLAAAKKELGK